MKISRNESNRVVISPDKEKQNREDCFTVKTFEFDTLSKDGFTLNMPKGAEIFKIRLKERTNGKDSRWNMLAFVDPNASVEKRTFRLIRWNNPILIDPRNKTNLVYIDTFDYLCLFEVIKSDRQTSMNDDSEFNLGKD